MTQMLSRRRFLQGLGAVSVAVVGGMVYRSVDQGVFSAGTGALDTTDVLGFIAVRDLYDRKASVDAGRAWQRLHLWATANELAVQPVNQMPEVVDRDHQLARPSEIETVMDELTGDPSWRPTFAFRMGYPQNAPLPSARRPVNEVTI